MYSNSVHLFSTLRVKYFVTVATYNTFIRKLKLSKWAGEPKCEGSVAHICKQTIKGNQSLFCGIHGSEKLAYICEIPKGKTKLLFIFDIELG